MKTPSRRLLLAGAVGSLLPFGPARAAGQVATPQQTEGPFYPTSFPADMDSDLVQVRGQQARAMGTVLHLEGRVLDLDGKPVDGALVEIWQCDAQGRYHHPAERGRADPAFQGFGRVSTDAQGRYRFRTIRPAPYSGRTPHIHRKVRLGKHEQLTTQLYVQGDPGNERDFLWRRLSPRDQQALTVPFVRRGDAWRADFPLVVEA